VNTAVIHLSILYPHLDWLSWESTLPEVCPSKPFQSPAKID